MLFPIFFLLACASPQDQKLLTATAAPIELSRVQHQGKNCLERFPTPKGYERVLGAYAQFLRSIPLKPHGTAVRLFNGELKQNQEAHEAVIDYDTGDKDLQQCADAVMRIRAEYLFSKKKFDQIHFQFTNGYRAAFTHWMQGKRLVNRGGRFEWVSTAAPDSSHHSLRSFLTYVYNYAGSLSLSRELSLVADLRDMQPGDVLIKGGSPGHAVTIMDVAVNAKGEKLFLLSQGYMPAQDIHILRNDKNAALSPWYALEEIAEYIYTPEYTFTRHQLMRFK